jgi:hypothetical protein
MGWDDVVFGAMTGGLYNVGKTAYKAGEAADEAGDAIEEISDGAGTALAAVGSTITKLGKDMSSFLKELEELLTIKRVTPRSEDDLWDEEVARLQALRAREAELVQELQQLEAEDDDRSWFDSFWDSMFGGISHEELVVRTKLAVVRGAINEILYEEPGVVTHSIHHVRQILERFNTMEQPRIEEIMDTVNDNLEESHGILKEVKKLFVVRTWKAVPDNELSMEKRNELELLESSLTRVDNLLSKQQTVTADLEDALVNVQPDHFTMDTVMKAKTSALRTTAGEKLTYNPDFTRMKPTDGHFLAAGPTPSIKGKVSMIAAQPMATSIATLLNENKVSAYMDNYHLAAGRVKYFKRERLKLEKAIYRIKWVPVDEPGVIPKILDEVEGNLEHVRTVTQPKIDTVIDNVAGTLTEATALIATLKETIGGLSKTFGNPLVRIGLIIGGASILVILVMSAIVLFRAAFGI